MEVGTLVREKEGARRCGIILGPAYPHRRPDPTGMDRFRHVIVLWPDGTKRSYKTPFLEPELPNPKIPNIS
jgi:hypothetical protein